MAFYTDTIESRPSSKTRAFFARFTKALGHIIAAQNRSTDVARMRNLSDRQLADMGLVRDDIVRHVYRDIYYV